MFVHVQYRCKLILSKYFLSLVGWSVDVEAVDMEGWYN
jgi:hypothetical protein